MSVDLGIRFIMACICGEETPCTEKDQKLGSVWQCPKCKVVTAAVYSKNRGKVWITVEPDEVRFYDFFEEKEREE